MLIFHGNCKLLRQCNDNQFLNHDIAVGELSKRSLSRVWIAMTFCTQEGPLANVKTEIG